MALAAVRYCCTAGRREKSEGVSGVGLGAGAVLELLVLLVPDWDWW